MSTKAASDLLRTDQQDASLPQFGAQAKSMDQAKAGEVTRLHPTQACQYG